VIFVEKFDLADDLSEKKNHAAGRSRP